MFLKPSTIVYVYVYVYVFLTFRHTDDSLMYKPKHFICIMYIAQIKYKFHYTGVMFSISLIDLAKDKSSNRVILGRGRHMHITRMLA